MLVTNQHSLSDAEDFTEGYRALKLGKVVGEPTAGWIIYTSNVPLLDGTVVRLPCTRITDASGKTMELAPRPVDVPVERPVGECYSGRDSQLDAAVRRASEADRHATGDAVRPGHVLCFSRSMQVATHVARYANAGLDQKAGRAVAHPRRRRRCGHLRRGNATQGRRQRHRGHGAGLHPVRRVREERGGNGAGTGFVRRQAGRYRAPVSTRR